MIQPNRESIHWTKWLDHILRSKNVAGGLMLFLSMLDVATCTYATYCLMKATTGSSDSHYIFKLELGYEMTIPLVKLRASHSTLTHKTKASMKLVGVLPMAAHQDASQGRRGGCYLCDRKKRLKSFQARCILSSYMYFVCSSIM